MIFMLPFRGQEKQMLEEDVMAWLENDGDPSYQMLNNAEIAEQSLGRSTDIEEQDSDGEEEIEKPQNWEYVVRNAIAVLVKNNDQEKWKEAHLSILKNS